MTALTRILAAYCDHLPHDVHVGPVPDESDAYDSSIPPDRPQPAPGTAPKTDRPRHARPRGPRLAHSAGSRGSGGRHRAARRLRRVPAHQRPSDTRATANRLLRALRFLARPAGRSGTHTDPDATRSPR